ncbi:methyl-accepting chemotaxis protein [Saccharospirillum sp. HFRX-1]|uniref:methyl-accepting chemotaxis protein n=1 Tax=unclassified Saccharospirillum TaxID=2633430 RepID=UPI0037207E99
MYWKRLPTRAKLMIAIGMPLVLMAIACFVIYTNVQKVKQSQEWVKHTYQVLSTADAIMAAAVDMETGMRGFLLAGQEQFLDPYKNGETQLYSLLDELMNTVSDNPPQVERLRKVETTLTEWQANVTEPVIQMRRNVRTPVQMMAVVNRVAEARGKVYFDSVRSLMAEFKQIESDLLAVRDQDNTATMIQTERVLMYSILTAFLIGIGIGLFVIRELLNTLGGEPHEVAQLLGKVAGGNLSIDVSRKAPVNSLYSSLRNMVDQLKVLITDVKSAADTINGEAEKISVISEESSNASSVQVSETTQVATAIEEMSATVREVASSVQTTANASRGANDQALDARSAMTSAVSKMNELNSDIDKAANAIKTVDHNTNEINSIVEVIRGIAEQTNLLALNAAIEAARAGEEGRGFAVVADEVRTLAERTGHSTNEINGMIANLQTVVQEAVQSMSSSQAQSQSVSESVQSTDALISSMQEAIQNISDMSIQISSSAEEQSIVVADISKNVSVVNELAIKTSDGSKKTSSLIRDLVNLSSSLKRSVDRFTV